MHPPFTLVDAVAACVVAMILIGLASILAEPTRQRFMAIFVAGAGAAYLDGGFGPVELIFTALASVVAFKGLESYRFIALGWVMHTGWDVAHHLWGKELLSFAPGSSAQCAVCDLVLAAWFFAGAPTRFFTPARS